MNPDLKTKKEKLEKELNAIAKLEQKQIIENNYVKIKNKFEGKYFKYKNSYSCPEKPSDYWFMYTKITEIKPSDIYDTRGNGVTSRFTGWTFQTDKYGNISIEKKKTGYVHSLGKEVTEKEFYQAWNKVNDELKRISKS